MTSSSSPALERGLDTMLLVYCTLQGHPAAPACEQFLRAHTGWFTSPLVLFEAKGILTKVYGVSPSDPFALIVSSVMLAAAALLACFLPARRATPANPITALRTE